MTKAAIVITVKNEERLLRENLAYHFNLGICKAYIYFDNTTDNGKKSIEHIENVVIQDSVSSILYGENKFLDKFTLNAKEHHTARQCLNTYDALINCRKENFDWLISIDADELFYPGKHIDLSSFFNLKKQVDVINLNTYEVINRKIKYDNVFAEETLFKTQKNFSSKLDQIHFQLANPYEAKPIKCSYWMGHTMGKQILNVNSDLIPHNVHRFKLKEGKTVGISKGFVLHYHMYDYYDFVKKFKSFKNHPPTFLSGNSIGKLKSFFIQLVNDKQFDEEYLKTYYTKNLLYDSSKIKRLKKTRFFNLMKRKEEAIILVDLPKKLLS